MLRETGRISGSQGGAARGGFGAVWGGFGAFWRVLEQFGAKKTSISKKCEDLPLFCVFTAKSKGSVAPFHRNAGPK